MVPELENIIVFPSKELINCAFDWQLPEVYDGELISRNVIQYGASHLCTAAWKNTEIGYPGPVSPSQIGYWAKLAEYLN